MKKRSLPYVTLLFLFLLYSCSENSSSGARTSLGIRTPEISSIEAITPAVSATTPYVNSGLWGLTTPVSLSEIDCFGIAVSYPEDTGSSCHLLNGGAIDIDEMFGSVESGELLQADISSGLNRNIQVIGFATSDGSCPEDISSLSKEQMANSSAPVILGEKLADVEGESMEVEIVISMTNPIAVNDCSGESYAWEEGAPKSNSISIENGYLTIVGSNLGSVRSATIKDAMGKETKLSVESRNNNGIALKAMSSLNLAMNMIYDLLISNAYGQEIFNISVGGSSGFNVVNISSDYDISATQPKSLFVVDGRYQLTLPSAAAAGAGFNIIVKSTAIGEDGIVRISSQPGEKIDGSYENMILTSHLATINLSSDGSNWWKLSDSGNIAAVESIDSCDNTSCYNDTAFDNVQWAVHSPTNRIIRRSGDLWEVPYAYENNMAMPATISQKYVIDNSVNSNNVSYHFTKVWSVAKYFDKILFADIGGGKFIGGDVDSVHNSGVSTFSIYDRFTNYNVNPAVNYSDNTGVSPVTRFLDVVSSHVGNGFNPSCYNYGGRLASTTDSLSILPAQGVTYWTSDFSSYDGTLSTTFYKTLLYDGSTVIEDTDDRYNNHRFLCIWSDPVLSFGLE